MKHVCKKVACIFYQKRVKYLSQVEFNPKSNLKLAFLNISGNSCRFLHQFLVSVEVVLAMEELSPEILAAVLARLDEQVRQSCQLK